MIALTLTEIATAVGGELHGAADPSATITGPVEHDSRKVAEGGLFVAITGERSDGHDFAQGAIADGALAVLGTRRVEGVPMILVDDPVVALGKLARAVVDRLDGLTIVAITGSQGKTSTKDLVAQMCARLGPTVANQGNLNNELGYPYTVLRADETTRYLVVESSARAIGDIAYLSRIAPPDVAVVLNVGIAHMGTFGSLDNIAVAKGELIEALPAEGLAVLNADDPFVSAMAPRTKARVRTVGMSEGAGLRAVGVVLDGAGRASFELTGTEGTAAVRLGLSGAHMVGNALSAAAVALELGMPFADLPVALGELRVASERRMDVFDRVDGVTVIDDSYNANPDSMAAAIRALAAIGEGRRRIAVLGYMAELAEGELECHTAVGNQAADAGVSLLISVQDIAAPISDAAAARGVEAVNVPDQEAAIAKLSGELRPGDVVLVKGSRYRTWIVADELRGAKADDQSKAEVA
ncbi:UDP-N-acetylmuramoyl-tripeptide--D-alanyl-D-alanine ligase [Phytomonospora sp. NPDC050363]|uniref:UDP-N-acetylmuramoyl-tripeptide--D-alanyl-D- alanine ligase n=1 Tax=Phytomonospora sp. NPDC050363 TaxID=3155642 RepID=UPI0033FEBCE1